MKLPSETVIASEKIRNYLLIPKMRNDKSKWLGQVGYTLDNWQLLEKDLRTQVLTNDAIQIEETAYGQMYEIKAKLTGPNGKSLSICTIWMKEKIGIMKFITLYPDKGEHNNEI